MGNYKVLMTDSILKDISIEENILKEAGAQLVLASNSRPETLAREGKDCDAILNVYAEVPGQVIEKLDRCKVIVRMGIGVNTIDIDTASQKGIMVANVPDYCLDEVADHTFSLMLSLVRKVCFLNNKVKNGKWDVNLAAPIPRLQEMVFGLLGFGNIAQKVSRRAHAFGFNVIAYDPFLPAEIFVKEKVKRIEDLGELISLVDILSLHAPLTKGTRNIINTDSLKKMKKTAYIINTSRGPLINEDDLLYALKNKLIAGAALDVLNQEPPAYPFALGEMDNLIVTPHASFYSEGSTPELRRKAASEIARTFTEGRPMHWINKK